MKTINNFINEKLKISSKSKFYSCQPKDKYELRKILEERLAEDKDADLNDIDVSQITDMSGVGFPNSTGLFEDLDPHDIDLSNWDVSKVKDMQWMFRACADFTGKGLENWNVSNVTNMYATFYGCENFNANLSKWDVSKVTNMKWMFYYCEKFTGEGLENWNVINIKSMDYMFGYCYSLKNKPSWY